MTIISVGLVSAGLLSFYQALGVVLGANIGTTLSSQIVALGLTDYFGLVLALGAGLRFLTKRERLQQWGRAIMGLGFREAVRTGVFHLLFNVFNVLLLGWFVSQLAELSVMLTPGEGPEAVARQIANAHVAFNVVGVLAILPFLKTVASALERMIPAARGAGNANGVPAEGAVG